MASRHSLTAIVILLALGLAACGGEGENNGVAVPGTISPEVGQPTAAAEATATTPAGGFTIIGDLFESQTKGYGVRFPEGWTADADYLAGTGFSVDAFFAPEEVGGVRPNVAVTCETLSEAMELRAYLDKKIEVAARTAQVEPEISSLQVAGQEALMSRFTREAAEVPLVRNEVVFFSDRCAWSVALTAPLGEETDYEELFRSILESFRLLP